MGGKPRKNPEKSEALLCYDRCQYHLGYAAISLCRAGIGGIRLTSRKCCGQWQTVHEFPVDIKQLKNDIREFELWGKR
jgi:hypothetical protein